jgi:hypothetical protein
MDQFESRIGRRFEIGQRTQEDCVRIGAEHKVEAFTTKTITNPKRLKAELARIRRQGWARDLGEQVASIMAFAARVFSRSGKLEAALSVPSLAWCRATPDGTDPAGGDHRCQWDQRGHAIETVDLRCTVTSLGRSAFGHPTREAIGEGPGHEQVACICSNG